MRRSAYAVAVLALVAMGTAQSEEPFPRPAELQPAISFWTLVYTQIDTQGGFIHDSEQLGVIYDTLHFSNDASGREKRRQIKAAIKKYHDILLELAGGSGENLNAEEQRVRQLWPSDVSRAELKRAANRLRFQLGQADRFRAGLIRSGTWRRYIEDTLGKAGLPRELAVLPHVESSFDPTAYSKVGAAGLWQFTRSTGLRYMRIDHIVDERRDPFFSTVAALQLLQANYAVLNSWPLAVTAYNHGLAGMRRAMQEFHTTDIGVITRRYDGRTFGFASRNFYAAFLAALDVDANAERYFGPLDRDPSDRTITIQVPDFVTAKTLAKTLHSSIGELRRLNPALMDTVWAGDKFVPKGFELRLPPRLAGDAGGLMASIPASERYASQQPDLYHRVRRGDTLSQIAAEYHVSLAALVRANGLGNRNFIRAGQVLTLPVKGSGQPPPTLAEAAAGGQYIVNNGDSIERIARRLGIDETSLLEANGIRNRNLIYAGQALRLPSSRPSDDAAAPQTIIDDNAALAADDADALGQTQEDAPVFTQAASVRIDPGADDAPLPRTPANTEAAEALDAEASDFSPDANTVAEQQVDLAADPSDYSVADDGTIEVQALETLGHYADWLQIKTQRLRDINGLAFGKAVVLGQRIRLDFSRVDARQFEQRRVAYQTQRQESFFSNYQIADVRQHIVKAGESLWVLARRTYNVPVWLLRQFNPDLDLDRVSPGTVVNFPLLQPIAKDSSQVSDNGGLG